MRIDIVTIFPEAFAPLRTSMLGRAQDRGLLTITVWDLRQFATDRHRQVDDEPYGGGPGMVMKPEPFFAAVDAIRLAAPESVPRIVLMSPQGERLDQERAVDLARAEHLIVLCGHYEGIDERVREGLGAEEISIGDYVLTGGELPAMVVVDAVARLVPGVVGAPASVAVDSFADGLLDYPHYTRPAEFRGMAVPDVLLSGDHEAIRRWRQAQRIRRTLTRRPDLLKADALSDDDRRVLEELDLEPLDADVPEL
ncbi:MAG TPA: tRNA (guanosine(37)-N1)-methyltransferase TrmD [bacterium]|jgi:tRNA (guanine37-N1)-methyltransferase|nr:tRNA (guanosine(37)-N1)-methyltransferase TrmD [bacterium]